MTAGNRRGAERDEICGCRAERRPPQQMLDLPVLSGHALSCENPF